MPESTSDATTGSRGPHRKGGIRLVLDVFSSVWTGIILAALLFFYCSVGSAVPAVRQLPWLEMTEFEWFHWWPFNVLVLLLCVTLTTVTVRRIPFRFVNTGVWMIHSGIIVLCIGSYHYFGTKVEGDAPVFRRQVTIKLPGMSEEQKLVVVPGAETSVASDEGVWRFRIQSTNTAWPILSDEHKGETAHAVSVAVTPPNGEMFVRQLLAGYEQYTEDIIPGKGRAIKILGKKLVDETVDLSLRYEPQTHFHVMDSWALFARPVGERSWVQREIKGLPRYADRIASRDQVFTDPHYTLPIRPIDLEVPVMSSDDPLAGVSLRITGYLRYAHMRREWKDGGGRLNPVARIKFESSGAEDHQYELVALDPRRRISDDGLMEFRWLADKALIESIPTDSRARLEVAVPEADVSFELPITEELLVGRSGPLTPIEGTDFSYRLLNVQDNLVLPGKGNIVSVAMVEIETPEGRFTRMVADQAEMTRDMHGDSADPHSPHGRTPNQADPRIIMKYQPRSTPIILAAHPEGFYFVYNGPDGREVGKEVAIGDLVELMPGLGVRIVSVLQSAVSQVKPFVVPPARRDRNAREGFSMIRLELDNGHGVQTKWLHFNQYAFEDDQYASSGRFRYLPEIFRLADGSRVEIMFSRERRPLPFPIALEDFALDTHVGGFTGSSVTIRNYFSRLRFLDDNKWTPPVRIAVNSPTEYGGYWYFQSTWDPPSRDNPGGGMNYTGLGVGNRNGVYTQLAGCCIAVAGMIFAFYVKPIVKRNRRARQRARAEKSQSGRVEPVDVPLAAESV